LRSAGACPADPRRRGRLADVVENPLHWSGLGDEGDDAPIGTSVRADQGQGFEQACQ